jgi:hypothetical protein
MVAPLLCRVPPPVMAAGFALQMDSQQMRRLSGDQGPVTHSALVRKARQYCWGKPSLLARCIDRYLEHRDFSCR